MELEQLSKPVFHEDGPQNRSRRRQNRSTEAKIGAEITLCFRQKSELSSDFYSDFGAPHETLYFGQFFCP
jgi:hypothetical protein